MENEIQKQEVKKDAISILKSESSKKRFTEILGRNAAGYLTSAMNVVKQPHLANLDQNQLLSCVLVAATLQLPIDNNLGFAYIVPFKGRPQFQIGYKGFIQLALRSGQFEAINAIPVYKSQFVSFNPLTEKLELDFSKAEDEVIGYAGYFRLLNGFEKTTYWTKSQVQKHAGKFSQTYKKNIGVWMDDFDAMAKKTVLKSILTKFAPLSVEMQQAVQFDQGVLKSEKSESDDFNIQDIEVEYMDNAPEKPQVDELQTKIVK